MYKELKVSQFKVNLHSDCTESGTSNIGYGGQRQCQRKQYNVYLTVYTNTKKNIIYVIQNSRTTISEGDFGSYSRDNEIAHFYIAKNDKDYNAALKSLKNGILPYGIISDIFLHSYDEQYYNLNNDFSFNISACANEDYVISNLKNNDLSIHFHYYDCFVYDDGLESYPSEDLCSNIYISLEDFPVLFDKKQRVTYLWDRLDIENAFLYNGPDGDNTKNALDESNFRQIIIDAIEGLKPTENNEDYVEMYINSVKEKVTAHSAMIKEREIRIAESNKKWAEMNPDAVYLTPQQKSGKSPVTVNDMVRINNGGNKELEYIRKILKSSDECEQWDAVLELRDIFNETDKKYSSEIDIRKIDISTALKYISMDLGLGKDGMDCLLKLPLNTVLNILTEFLTD